MSRIKNTEAPPSCTEVDNSAIDLLIKGKSKTLGGIQIRRVLPNAKKRMVGPWIFFDHMGPAVLDENSGVSVFPHPHINLATVTYLFEGEIFHRDSLGNAQSIFPGDINLMIAGHGITHSEREREEVKSTRRNLNGLQLWMALPVDKEEMHPEFLHYDKDNIPKTEINGVPVRVMIGTAFGLQSPVKTFCETLYLEAKLKEGQSLALPMTEERGLYVVEGSATVKGQLINQFSMAILSEKEVEIVATEDCSLVLVGGEKFEPRYIYWNFVSSSKGRIEKAKLRWRNKEFPIVPGDEEDYIPLPTD